MQTNNTFLKDRNNYNSTISIGNIIQKTSISLQKRSINDKVREYGSMLSVGLLLAGMSTLCLPLSATFTITFIATGTLTALLSLFKLTYRITNSRIPNTPCIEGSGKVIERHFNIPLEAIRTLKVDFPN